MAQAQRVVSRTQRRMERKQAVILVLLVLVVSLASFSLGVMVGRSGGREASPVVRMDQPLSLPKADSAGAVSTPAAGQSPLAATTDAVSGTQAPTDAAEGATDKLTFYDTLPRGEQPLGSGINLPPATTPAPSSLPEKGAAATRPVRQARPAAVSKPVVPAPRTAPSAAPVAGSGYVVQIASFQKAEQATALRNRLAGKGYVTFVKRTDLGSKGIWHRVYAGPYSERGLADKAAGRLRKEEKFSPLVRKR